MDEKISVNDRVTFVVGFIALLLALSPFKDSLDMFKIEFFTHQISLTGVLLIMTGILFLSVYLSAIDYLKYTFNSLLDWKIPFKYTSILADFFYVIAILFPLLVLIFWIIISAIQAILSLSETDSTIISLVLSVISAIIGAVIANLSLKISKKAKEKFIEESNELEKDSILKAQKAFKDGYYEFMLIELNNSIVNQLYKKLAEKVDIRKRFISTINLIEIAFKYQIINSQQKGLLDDLRVLRNNAAHGKLEAPISKESAKELLEQTRKFLNDLE